MRGLRFLGNSKVEMVELPDPKPRKGDILVRVKASAICGSEVETYRLPRGVPWGGNPGHEVMGVVEDPNGSTRFRNGDRVGVVTIQGCGECFWCRQGKQDFCKKVTVITNGHSDYVVGKECWMQAIPDDIEDGIAVLLAGDGMGVPYGATIRSGLAAGDTTCVFGTGPVGGAMVIMQTFLGARVIAIDINPMALERATKWGAWKTINPKDTEDLKGAILELTNGLGPNKSYDACGNQEMFNLAMDVTMPGGTVMTVAHGTHGIDNVCERLSFHHDGAKGEYWGRNLTVMGDWSCHFSDFTDQVAMIRNGLPIASLITARYPLEQFDEAYQRFMGGLEGKVIFIH